MYLYLLNSLLQMIHRVWKQIPGVFDVFQSVLWRTCSISCNGSGSCAFQAASANLFYSRIAYTPSIWKSLALTSRHEDSAKKFVYNQHIDTRPYTPQRNFPFLYISRAGKEQTIAGKIDVNSIFFHCLCYEESSQWKSRSGTKSKDRKSINFLLIFLS